VARNFKRIAEVWLDDWKKFLYKTNESRFAHVDAGDLTKQKEIRRRLNCKPFDYFVHWIAPEMTKSFATPHDEDLAFGSLQVSNGNQTLCISDNRAKFKTCTLDECGKSKTFPYKAQFFHLTSQKLLKHDRAEKCFEKRRYEKFPGYRFGDNKWTFSLKTHQIVHENGFYCLAANFANQTLQLKECDVQEVNQIWSFGFVNQTMVMRLEKENV
jgi:polypeptide N-acetylgalactosaminyltransferase